MSEHPATGPATGTYRIQLRGTSDSRHFGFAEAAELAPYLAALGVSHVYLSPVLQAAPGSTHGYDVIEHDRLSAELGGPEAFRAMAARFHGHGLRVLADIVPNHMAVPDPPELNGPLAALIEDGAESPYARWFDVDWEEGGGRIVLPGRGEPNYRRFFDISGLICLSQEDPEVFRRTHALMLGLVAEGLVDALRVDHPDGLADPRGYLERLSDASSGPDGPRWILVEKITTGGERLPGDWRCAGTTGYDALGMVGGVFADPDGERPLTEAYVAFTGGGPASFDPVEYEARRFAAEHALRPEMSRLLKVLCRVLRVDAGDGARRADLQAVLLELLAAMHVYRAYVVPGEPPTRQAVEVLEEAAERARTRLPARLRRDLDLVVRLALGHEPKGGDPGDLAEFVVRFQQTSAPLAAKGVEDTAFYRWSRMASLNEVGGDPSRFAIDPEDFHAYCAGVLRDWPATMTTLSTHDTKRQEDVRARLAVLAELPVPWTEAVGRWRAWAPKGSPLEPDLEYLLWQTLVGAWPIAEDRLGEFLTKAMREAKTRTSWLDPDSEYEKAVLGYARRALVDEGLTADVGAFVAMLEPYARVNALGQKLVQLTMPGVPDVYQGCELTGLALVDPDNRRPVDYERRRERLARLDGGGEPRDLDDEKLLVTSRTLRLRRERPGWFGEGGGYEPVRAGGEAARHVLAFRRGGGEEGALTVATRLPAGLERAGGWGDTYLEVGPVPWRNLLTGEVHQGPRLEMAVVLAVHPVALLVSGVAE
ncbi:malto-oligosyltrehalose synthase [Actinomadura rugatobispora]|uniref:Malto-oligosyltrehalose synthase n=1 Tax=Actinomadura rugatobispora TaxID=1994 RepID=A0ABW1AFH8_9ACTN|nr:malto-oligosyltrehalose synthase [Actinomadura rugatobispora]